MPNSIQSDRVYSTASCTGYPGISETTATRLPNSQVVRNITGITNAQMHDVQQQLSAWRKERLTVHTQFNEQWDRLPMFSGEKQTLADKYFSDIANIDRKINQYTLDNIPIEGVGIDYKARHLPPVKGSHGKLAALALVDAYFAEKYAVINYPLLAEGRDVMSLRRIAKILNSCQGEVLERSLLESIAKDIGYNVQMLYPENIEDFTKLLRQNIESKGLISFYTASHLLSPAINPTCNELMENATVITRYNEQDHTCTVIHMGKQHTNVPLSLLFESNQNLVNTRNPEYYSLDNKKKVRLRDPVGTFITRSKYPPVEEKEVLLLNSRYGKEYLKTITPAAGSGFKGLLMVLEPNMNDLRWADSPV